MKKILVLSDIHVPSRVNNFPYDHLTKYMSDIDMIFGLGDYVSQSALSSLYGFNKEVYAVSGNMDDYLIKSQLPAQLNITVEDISIVLTHGWGPPNGIRERLYKEFNNSDLICYGHTHASFFKEERWCKR